MKTAIYSLFLGVLFGIGLGISQMTNPAKVVNFLDLMGNWDPSLAFVMAGAMSTYLVGYKFIFPKLKKPMLGDIFQIPETKSLDKFLVLGSVIFGVGWALSGYCPAPGITSIVTFSEESIVFVSSMSIGILIYHFIFKRKKYQDG